MSNQTRNKSANVRGCGVSARTPGGSRRLTTPVHVGAFLARRSAAWKGTIMATSRTDLEDTLHRLSNLIECKLSTVITELLAEGRSAAVCDVAYSGARFIEVLRETRDGKEGGEG